MMHFFNKTQLNVHILNIKREYIGHILRNINRFNEDYAYSLTGNVLLHRIPFII